MSFWTTKHYSKHIYISDLDAFVKAMQAMQKEKDEKKEGKKDEEEKMEH